MPATAARLMPLACRARTASVDQIEDILRYDPGLTPNILKLTNSAYFGLPSQVQLPCARPSCCWAGSALLQLSDDLGA